MKPIHLLTPLAAAALAAATLASWAAAASPIDPPKSDAEAGADYARAYCSSCHAVGGLGASPNPQAPPFRVIADKYPPEQLSETLVEGIEVGHPKMPRFIMAPERADQLVAYLKTLRTK